MNDIRRYKIFLTGIVQGVGFRPFVYRIANLFCLKGWVNNQSSMVVIDIEGEKSNINFFLNMIIENPPELAKIKGIKIHSKKPKSYSMFSIVDSKEVSNSVNFVPTDTAVCEKCLKDINNVESHRYRYAFTNCTNCGPRYSIIKSLPYDRKNTTMSDFDMCNSCKTEYYDPYDRRFHAQPNCCFDCGPSLKLMNEYGINVHSIEPIKDVIKLLKQGKIIAIKGIGGYHLCCNALDKEVVKKLRIRKKRPHKPLAVMAMNIAAIENICYVSKKEKDILLGKQKPIVLLNKKIENYFNGYIAPNQKKIGVMVPYTPLHKLLFFEGLEFIVMTSGNISGLPICYKDEEALQSLGGIADYFLIHNREINTPVDDSVVKVVDENEIISRFGRGYSPNTISIDTKHEILAVGSEQKSSICMTQNGYANISQYIGDLKDYNTYKVFSGIIDNFKGLFNTNPKIYVHDFNEDYLSSHYVKVQNGIKIAVQHHHAHMAACMEENRLSKDVIGVIFDGTGLGTDGTVWGGEFFIGSKSKYKRVGHLKCVTLQGGDTLIKEPWRTAVSYLLSMDIEPKKILHSVDFKSIEVIKKAIGNGINCYKSSSMGRLFDCVAALIGLRYEITYDAQAAIELESKINESVSERYIFRLSKNEDEIILDYQPIILGVLNDIKAQVSIDTISTKFHNTIVRATTECLCRIRSKTGLNDVVLCGGVFENTYILESMIKSLSQIEFQVYYNMQIPTNDNGISFGQAVVASEILKEGTYVSCYSC